MLGDALAIDVPDDAREFGFSLAHHDGRLLVGAPGTGSEAGAAFLIEGSIVRTVVEGAAPGDRAGHSVDVGPAGWVVGAPHRGDRVVIAAAEIGQGSVHLEDGSSWLGREGDCFGSSVAVADDGRVLAGAPCRGSQAFQHESLPRPMLVFGPGAVTVIDRGAPVATVDGAEPWDQLGHSVAWMGDAAVTGAPDYFGGDWINQLAQGEVHVFRDPPQGELTSADADLTIAGGQGSRELHDDHGWAVATGDLDGDGSLDLVTGSPEFSDFERQGGAWMFSAPSDGDHYAWDADAALAGATQPGINARAGAALAVGDVNCDGDADLVLGAPLRTTDADRAGAVYVVFGPIAAWEPLAEADRIYEGRGLGTRAGTAVAVGDEDRDGCADILIGAPGANGGEGAVYVVSSAPSTD